MFDTHAITICSSVDCTRGWSVLVAAPPEADAMNEPFACERDHLMVPRLTGAARRHPPGREPATAETAATVRDLLAEVAGLLIGYHRRTAEEVKARGAAYYCMAAAEDLALIPRWVEVAASPWSRRGGWRSECVRRMRSEVF